MTPEAMMASEGKIVAAVHAWIREDAPLAIKMTIMPAHVDALIAKLAALRATEPPVPVDRERGDLISRTAALDAICELRTAADRNCTPAYSGSLGKARFDSFWEAAQAVRLLPASTTQAPQQRTDTGEVGDA